ncbi:MAG TPA: methionine biosynthesis protein MetW [Turneriella sp.]|nr:methionine biosynthesis protein MetW [Turneriella sp.]HNA80690.1 methionine biosynthesis protein MetW [Turneriella sp.]HNE19582.1 methionine biosynthesis protein MetW [Turneriella sp.]HNL11664.1 methionine biosynthesis protein MetW [Turneriella sp.]HNL54063.1 methionine biosynthesis protein MetW [Turneriella sp.]
MELPIVELQTERIDYRIILTLVGAKSRVLDMGCGDGELLYLLNKNLETRSQGIEIDHEQIMQCVERGINVLLGDLDSGLTDFKDNSFDYVILNNALQELRYPDDVIKDALRVGKNLIVGFPNFAYYKARLQFFLSGRTPVTPSLPFAWYESPNLHLLTIDDFKAYCAERGFRILSERYVRNQKEIYFRPNLLAQWGIFLITR